MKFLITIVLALVSSQTFASSAVQYNCLGKDAVSGNSIFFEVDFSDYGPEVGYTNQSITIVKNGDETLEKPITFQMYGATKKNSCTKTEFGEIYLKSEFEMTPTQNDDIADYKVTVKTDCPDNRFDIKAYCQFQ